MNPEWRMELVLSYSNDWLKDFDYSINAAIRNQIVGMPIIPSSYLEKGKVYMVSGKLIGDPDEIKRMLYLNQLRAEVKQIFKQSAYMCKVYEWIGE